MNDRARTAIAFLLIIGILFLWSLLSKSKNPDVITKPDTLDTITMVQKSDTLKPLPELMPEYSDTIVIDRPEYRIVLSTAGASVKEFYLRQHNVNIVPDNEHLFITLLENKIPNFVEQIFEDSVVFTYESKGSVRKTYYFNNQVGFHLKMQAEATTNQVLSLKAGMRVTEEKNRGEDLRYFNVYVKDEKVVELKKKIKDEFVYAHNVEWLALRSKYFALVMNNLAQIDSIHLYKLPKDESPKTANLVLGSDNINKAVFGCYFMRGGGDRFGAVIKGGQIMEMNILLLPVKHSMLATYKQGYEQMASGGIMGPISRLILLVFNFFYSIFQNYGVAIILFAFLIKAIFFPLSRRMIQSQQKMQMIQPELKKIQKKYKDDPQRLNQEMMQLYKTYKVNPLSGCLPLLVQMPIFFALYQTLITSIEFRQAPFVLWLVDLSIKDPYYVLPISMGVIMLIQSLMTTIDPRQRFMVIIMPLFMVFIFLNFPSGLQLYWFSYNILTLVEHIITKRGGIT